MTTETNGGSSIPARVFAVTVILAGGSIDTEILEALARANAPDSSRTVLGVELPSNYSDGHTVLSSGYVAFVQAPQPKPDSQPFKPSQTSLSRKQPV